MQPGSIMDIVFLALLLIMVLRAGLRGFIREIFALAAIGLAIPAAVFFYRKGGVFIREKLQWEARLFTEILAFIIIFLLVFGAVRLIYAALRDIVERVNLGQADRLLGVLAGAAEGIVLIAALLALLSAQPLFDPAPFFQGSVFAKYLLPLIRAIPVEQFLPEFPPEIPPEIPQKPVSDSYV